MITTLEEYRLNALRTWNPPQDRPKILNLAYLSLGLPNEAGEVAGKLKKVIRDNNSIVDDTIREALKAELGDTLWYLTVLATELGLTLEEIATANIDKLASRLQRGVIHGSGDNR
jgi:NTP pyrophosphatase (non-canonical NTP hydrolase)